VTKKVVSVFVRFRAPLQSKTKLQKQLDIVIGKLRKYRWCYVIQQVSRVTSLELDQKSG
jgi:hypothetical protein